MIGLAKRLAAASALMAMTIGESWACSPVVGYQPPTNYELVEMADAIVVATALDETESPERGGPTTLRFRVDSLLKGVGPKELREDWSYLGDPRPSDPHDLESANEEWATGACIRREFAQGKSYVLFLTKSDGVLSQMGGFATRVNEDYFGDQSLWVRVIRAYTDIQAKHDGMGQLEALVALRQSLSTVGGDADAKEWAEDIGRQLGSLSKSKPTAYLIDAYERLERGENLRFEAWPDAAPDELKQRIIEALSSGSHPDAAAFLARVKAPTPK